MIAGVNVMILSTGKTISSAMAAIISLADTIFSGTEIINSDAEKIFSVTEMVLSGAGQAIGASTFSAIPDFGNYLRGGEDYLRRRDNLLEAAHDHLRGFDDIRRLGREFLPMDRVFSVSEKTVGVVSSVLFVPIHPKIQPTRSAHR